ncbi:hypothetical protein DFH09DRAFT_1426074 [Mycena vulgaris]|nr:hypothetical protein DFH09DRAFT_1426074 [Mycena vulgaris]
MRLITIDDANGDPSNGARISYQPPTSWINGAIGGCPGCAGPSLQIAFMNTWHGSVFNGKNKTGAASPPTATMFFFDTVIDLDVYSGTSDMTFFIDGVPADTFSHAPTGAPGFLANVTVFTSQPLPLQNHTLGIQNGSSGPSLVILDSITYASGDGGSPTASTTGTSSTGPSGIPVPQSGEPHTSRTQAILGTVLSVGVVLALALLFLWFRRRRSRRIIGHVMPSPPPSISDLPEIHVITPYLKAHAPPSSIAVANPLDVGTPAQPQVPTSEKTRNPETRSLAASSIRRQYLQRELRAAQEEIVDINGLERHLSTSRRWSSTTRNLQGAVAQLETARQRNEALVARIQELEGQLQSAWALGLSDDPPPGYTSLLVCNMSGAGERWIDIKITARGEALMTNRRPDPISSSTPSAFSHARDALAIAIP